MFQFYIHQLISNAQKLHVSKEAHTSFLTLQFYCFSEMSKVLL